MRATGWEHISGCSLMKRWSERNSECLVLQSEDDEECLYICVWVWRMVPGNVIPVM